MRTRMPVTVEIGCGDGRNGSGVDDGLRLGIDIDLAALRVASKTNVRMAFVCADGESLPVRAGVVDAVMIRAVLHHLADIDAALRGFARALEPAGTLTIIDAVALPESTAAELDAELAASGLPRELHYGFDVDQLPATVARAGLRVRSLHIDGVATFATPPFVSRDYYTDRFILVATKHEESR